MPLPGGLQHVDPALAQQLAAAGGGGPNGMPTQQDVAQATAQKEEQEQARADMLMRLLSADAKERLNRIALVKPDKARRLEEMVIMMARQGRLQGQMEDSGLKHMLEQIEGAGGGGSGSGVTYTRRRAVDSDDEEIDLSDL